MAEEATGILTEDQLQRLIEAEEWDSGEGESESEAEEVLEEQDKQQQHCWQPSEEVIFRATIGCARLWINF